MEQRCLQPYVKVTSANLECKSYVQKNLDGSSVQHGRIHSYSNAAPN
jgi:hypothetical protein